jgi:hypothetical protein
MNHKLATVMELRSEVLSEALVPLQFQISAAMSDLKSELVLYYKLDLPYVHFLQELGYTVYITEEDTTIQWYI